jgi:hypothetical protein
VWTDSCAFGPYFLLDDFFERDEDERLRELLFDDDFLAGIVRPPDTTSCHGATVSCQKKLPRISPDARG